MNFPRCLWQILLPVCAAGATSLLLILRKSKPQSAGNSDTHETCKDPLNIYLLTVLKNALPRKNSPFFHNLLSQSKCFFKLEQRVWCFAMVRQEVCLDASSFTTPLQEPNRNCEDLCKAKQGSAATNLSSNLGLSPIPAGWLPYSARVPTAFSSISRTNLNNELKQFVARKFTHKKNPLFRRVS